jgi:hypothetical protein
MGFHGLQQGYFYLYHNEIKYEKGGPMMDYIRGWEILHRQSDCQLLKEDSPQSR